MIASLEDIARDHQPVLIRAAGRLGFGEADAADLVQSVWQTFVALPSRFEGRSQLRTFLIGVLRNKAREEWRRRQRADAAEPEPYTLEPALLARTSSSRAR